MLSRRMAIGALVASGAGLTGIGRPMAAPAVDVPALQESWRAAFGSGNGTALDAIYSDRLVYVHSDARIQNKEQLLAPFKSGALKFSTFAGCDTPRMHVYEGAAIVSACYELKTGSGPASRHLFMTTWVNEGGRWRIAAQQTTRLPDKP